MPHRGVSDPAGHLAGQASGRVVQRLFQGEAGAGAGGAALMGASAACAADQDDHYNCTDRRHVIPTELRHHELCMFCAHRVGDSQLSPTLSLVQLAHGSRRRSFMHRYNVRRRAVVRCVGTCSLCGVLLCYSPPSCRSGLGRCVSGPHLSPGAQVLAPPRSSGYQVLATSSPYACTEPSVTPQHGAFCERHEKGRLICARPCRAGRFQR
mmetsp:Transcript_26776/g.80354  ORF Transcript_26776/g.80354 Transcript_26776/m.80354 type:complete len:209 (+) Transcript_26776:1152-1778(+)